MLGDKIRQKPRQEIDFSQRLTDLSFGDWTTLRHGIGSSLGDYPLEQYLFWTSIVCKDGEVDQEGLETLRTKRLFTHDVGFYGLCLPQIIARNCYGHIISRLTFSDGSKLEKTYPFETPNVKDKQAGWPTAVVYSGNASNNPVAGSYVHFDMGDTTGLSDGDVATITDSVFPFGSEDVLVDLVNTTGFAAYTLLNSYTSPTVVAVRPDPLNAVILKQHISCFRDLLNGEGKAYTLYPTQYWLGALITPNDNCFHDFWGINIVGGDGSLGWGLRVLG